MRSSACTDAEPDDGTSSSDGITRQLEPVAGTVEEVRVGHVLLGWPGFLDDSFVWKRARGEHLLDDVPWVAKSSSMRIVR